MLKLNVRAIYTRLRYYVLKLHSRSNRFIKYNINNLVGVFEVRTVFRRCSFMIVFKSGTHTNMIGYRTTIENNIFYCPELYGEENASDPFS